MVKLLGEQLTRWAQDPTVAHVVISGAGDKAFCAGGDIRSIYDARQAGKASGLSAFFSAMNICSTHRSRPIPSPILPWSTASSWAVGSACRFMAATGSERKKTLFAMPETGIGFFPDVGGTWFLPRMPKRAGVYCALSGGRMKQGDALETGVLTHAVAESSLADLERSLETAADIDAALASYLVSPEKGVVSENADLIDQAFSGDMVADILSRLDAADSEFAHKTARTIREKSPTSVLIAFEQMKRGPELSFNECMRLEYRIVCHILEGRDFFEGVRAVLVDKDQNPQWSPSQLGQVDSGDLASYFQEPSGGDLPLAAT
ncbi:enoyl-CoA hydratase/isomerase family protein [Roseibium salinum]|nr:enoyl-CoA hydratase/isomerase family protein [Roseibium salinum]